MASSGLQKAAVLLMTLDPATAGELLKSASPRTITEVAAELAYLDATGQDKNQLLAESIKEFATMLGSSSSSSAGGGAFVKQMVATAVGREKSQEIMGQVRGLVEARDPFMQVRSAAAEDIAAALAAESPAVAGMVLAELSPEKSAQLLSLLKEEIRGDVIRAMATSDKVLPEAIARVAAVMRRRLDAIQSSGSQSEGDERLRNVAVLLRSLNPELQESMVQGIADQAPEVAETVRRLMVIWEDIPRVAERSMQEALRQVDARSLALAIQEADATTVSRIRDNISERQGTMLDEEVELLSAPKADEIEKAREAILDSLREMAQMGELNFEESQ